MISQHTYLYDTHTHTQHGLAPPLIAIQKSVGHSFELRSKIECADILPLSYIWRMRFICIFFILPLRKFINFTYKCVQTSLRFMNWIITEFPGACRKQQRERMFVADYRQYLWSIYLPTTYLPAYLPIYHPSIYLYKLWITERPYLVKIPH